MPHLDEYCGVSSMDELCPKIPKPCQNLVGEGLSEGIFVARDKIGTKMFMGGVKTKCIFYLDGWMDGWMDVVVCG